MIEFYLEATIQKSYYKKAKIMVDDKNIKWLKSYNTIVAKIDGNKLIKLWNGYSKTTLRHIKDFCKMYNIFFEGTKKAWLNLPYYGDNKSKYKVIFWNGFAEFCQNLLFDNYEGAENYGEQVTAKKRFWSYRIEEA